MLLSFPPSKLKGRKKLGCVIRNSQKIKLGNCTAFVLSTFSRFLDPHLLVRHLWIPGKTFEAVPMPHCSQKSH